MIEVEWVSETSNDINDKYRCQPAEILLNSVAAKLQDTYILRMSHSSCLMIHSLI